MYAFAEADDITTQLETLQDLLDPSTGVVLDSLGDQSGRRWLEIGYGLGSGARELSRRVGPSGTVHACDLDTRPLSAPADGAPIHTFAHDLRTDALTARSWDGIHGRLVLLHIAERREILPRLVDALEPGGVLVIEDWFCPEPPRVLTCEDPEDAKIFTEVVAGVLAVLRGRGADLEWAAAARTAFEEAGLTAVRATRTESDCSGPGLAHRLYAINARQLRPQLLAVGLSEELLDRFQDVVAHPGLTTAGWRLISTVGIRPVTA
ncbi:class I SAM-dependent methyltransferase [Streptomyces sp. SID3343]|uniref:class I SAM-dependent methyltransferase n=1 Tax=Streptomyces sp. SID3343 TaxID=2690260 RepID=UPI00136890DC|nr:class I SAM-dependent methyltransferase [Streptomyces sp. SID3343]MYW03639.1 methyltransferase domain-containing protein [Streptomyces sp. SID3343]